MPDMPFFRAHFRWALTCLIFFALPVLILAFGLGRSWEREERTSLERCFRRLDNLLLAVRRRENTAAFFTSLLDLLTAKMDQSRNEEERRSLLRLGSHSLHKRFPGIIHMLVVDAQGTPLQEFSNVNPGNVFSRRLFQLKMHGSNDRQLLENSWPMFKSFIGPNATPDQFLRENSLSSVSAFQDRRWFYSHTHRNFAAFVWIDNPNTWSILSITDQVQLYQKLRPLAPIRLGLRDLAEPGFPDPDLAIALGEFQRTTQRHMAAGNHIFSLMTISPTVRLWASIPRSEALDRTLYRGLFALLASLVFGWFALFCHRVMIGGRSFAFPIRLRLILLFAFASGIPLGLIIFAGWEYLDQLRQARVRETFDELERSLVAFDGRYSQMRGQIERELQRFLQNRRMDTPDQMTGTTKVLSRLFKRYAIRDMCLFTERGKLLWYRDESEVKSAFKQIKAGRRIETTAKFMAPLVSGLAARLNKESTSLKSDMTMAMAESITMGENPIDVLARELGRIMDFSFGPTHNWLNLTLYRNPEGRVTHCSSMSWGKDGLERFYLSRALGATERSLPGTRILALRTKDSSPYPSSFPHLEHLRTFLQDLLLRQGTTFQDIGIGQKRFLVAGIKPRNLDENMLIAVRDDEPIRREVTRVQHNLQTFAVIITAISLFIGVLLSQRILTPIKHLSIGVSAIEDRRFAYRLPPFDPDELGQLAATFNRVMEGLSDLEVARIVQESLFPAGEITSGPYRAYGVCHTATELGGDYFDLKALPDGRILIIIGDVSGHGVPAALVMAMAKALVEHLLQDGVSLERMLPALNRVLFLTMKRKRLMTCFFALVDPERNVMQFVNAGHNYPFAFPAHGAPTLIEFCGFPLGSRAQVTTKVAELSFAPGDTVLFYTDGLVETYGRHGVIGYHGVQDAVPGMLTTEPRETCERIYAWCREVADGQPQDDDITLLVLRRSNEKEDGS
ncbi:MAG: SpoIIE family protein phosphatase [Candidatus Ozemobacteraceae bacterium]